MPKPWRRSKKLCRTRCGSPRETRARHTDRGVVPGRDAGRPEEQTDLSLGQERLAAPGHPRSAYPIDLSVRCGVPRTWDRRRPRAASLQQRGYAASSHEIAIRVTPGAHAIVILDQAGWHGAKGLRVPSNISLMPLPPRSPELNPQENIWQFMRQNWLSNRVFKTFDDIVDHCCYAWNTLIDQPWKIMSIARRDWAIVGQSM